MLTIHRAERADRLVDALASNLVEPLDDPFTAEVVSVPTRGIERWLTQRLSTVLGASPGRHDGVCANIEFPFPGRLVGNALAAATGIEPDADPWLPERAVWPLLDVVDQHLDEEWLAPLAGHLGGAGPDADELRRGRRFGAVSHLADLFDHYGHHRPALIAGWAGGDDTDGRGGPLPPDVAWQAPLWRLLRVRIATPSPAERLATACDRLRDEPGVVDLPARLSLFGLTRLAASHVEVLAALGAARDVRLFLLHPSPVLWQRVGEQLQPGGRRTRPPRRDDRTAALAHNPLLATWGRDARELQLVVAAHAGADVHHPVDGDTSTLLRRLQEDVRADRLPPGASLDDGPDGRLLLDPTDRSVQVHSCHGQARQVEVLRDAVLHLFADDPTLEPRDVIVMCPDIEAFAPLIHATFGSEPLGEGPGQGDVGGPPDLRVRLADRSLRQTNPILGVVAELLVLADSRLTASEVVDLASRGPIRRRFHLDEDDVTRIEEWVAEAGIRWGLDAAHRAPFQLDDCADNTWQAGLARLLLGVTMAEDDLRLVDGVLPLDDVDSGDIELAGRLAELVDRLAAAIATLRGPQSIGGWVDAIADAADQLAATSPRDAWQRDELTRLLADLVDESASTAIPLALAEVRTLVADRLRGRPTRANFRTGHLTMCTLVPMRSVPHRVVCLLGLDDGTFPRRTAPDGDDILERDPCVGDRDVRSEDRQLLLDAMLAATDHLVATYCGRDERTNAVQPPAVPLGELLDVVDATARTATGPARRQVLVEHPLQTFDDRNFDAGALVPGSPWSFDPVALDGALARWTGPQIASPFLAAALPPAGDGVVELDDLVRFVQHPVRAFLRRRLGVSLGRDEEETDDGLPVELDALAKWAVGQRLVEQRLAGHDLAACIAAERARGTLPPGQLGAATIDEVVPTVEQIVAAVAGIIDFSGASDSIDVDVDLGGLSLVGTVNGVVGVVVRAATYSRVGPKHRLTAWVRLLAVSAGQASPRFSAATIGRGRIGVGVATIAPIPADTAIEQLGVLVDLYARGMREPVPLYCDTSAAYAAAPAGGRSVRARNEWTTTAGGFDGEDRDAAHLLVLGDDVAFDDIERPGPAPDECGPGWHDDVDSRFGRYALRLWEGLLAAERRSGL